MSPNNPYVQPLPRAQRRLVFIFLIILFVVAMPLLVFYAIGYRFDFSDGGLHNIMSVGGMYVNTEAENVSIYIDNKPVEDLRIFQRAAYIQNLKAGVHQLHVQGNGVQTWVKNLPVFAHFVTEAAAFNMPIVPQIRLITKYQTINGALVVEATSTPPLSIASTTQSYVLASSTIATSTYIIDPEYAYIVSLFASTTEERLLLNQLADLASESFVFSETVPTNWSIMATTTVIFNDIQLSLRAEDVFATWLGDTRDIPYYFCVNPAASSSPIFYGAHVTNQIFAAASSTVFDVPTAPVFEASNRLCRTEIRIDRKWQMVKWFSFVPGSRDLVLMHLSDGIYVVEIDDRAWQNTQLLYPGTKLDLIIDGERIMVKDNNAYFEVYTELTN
ncbi:MAG: hypothetical protein AUK16_02370 [Parcubacteria group bacterium CG2_30_44_11]|nr:MAG: hypothetical protein AUK16_02370 [Parcubacteria group bacterium CG2_30_44_11]